MYTLMISVTILLSLEQVISLERKLTLTVNPGCDIECENITGFVAYSRADSENDTLHHIWDFTSGRPTLVLALSSLQSKLNIDWAQFLDGAPYQSVTLQPQPSYVFSFIINKIIEFNDVNNTGLLDELNTDRGYLNVTEMKNFKWDLVTESLHNSTERSSITAKAPISEHNQDSLVQVMLSAFGKSDHSGILPHLLHTANSSQVDLILDNLQISHPSSRFGINLITVSTDPDLASPPTIRPYKTIDDEHSPGIFRMNEMLTSDNGGYLEWRSVAYTSSNRSMTTSTNIHHYEIQHSDDGSSYLARDLQGTLVYAMFGSDLMANMSVNSFNVSIGAHGDGYYSRSNFTSWTLLVGLGEAGVEEFSNLILTVLIVGLGLPTLLILVALACIVVRRFSNNANDMFLSQ